MKLATGWEFCWDCQPEHPSLASPCAFHSLTAGFIEGVDQSKSSTFPGNYPQAARLIMICPLKPRISLLHSLGNVSHWYWSRFKARGMRPSIVCESDEITLQKCTGDGSLVLSPSQFSSVHLLSRIWFCDPVDCSTPGFPVHHQLLEFTQTHVHRVSDAIQPSHLLLSPSSPTFNLSQHQGLFQWVSSSHQVAKVLEFQVQHQSFQWIFRTDFL